MFSLYPIRPTAENKGSRWDDYEFSLVGIIAAPFVSLVALPFFAIKALKDSPVLTERSAEQQNDFDRDCRKVRFYARRLIPIIGYYWGHRLYEKQEKYQTLLILSADQIEALAFKRASAVVDNSHPEHWREKKLAKMIDAVVTIDQVNAILTGIKRAQSENGDFLQKVYAELLQDSRAQVRSCLSEEERDVVIPHEGAKMVLSPKKKQVNGPLLHELPCEQIEALAFEKAKTPSPSLFVREARLCQMIQEVHSQEQVAAILQGMRQAGSKNPIFPQVFKYLFQGDPQPAISAWNCLSEEEQLEVIGYMPQNFWHILLTWEDEERIVLVDAVRARIQNLPVN